MAAILDFYGRGRVCTAEDRVRDLLAESSTSSPPGQLLWPRVGSPEPRSRSPGQLRSQSCDHRDDAKKCLGSGILFFYSVTNCVMYNKDGNVSVCVLGMGMVNAVNA